MALSVTPLLLHSDALPEAARIALADAFAQPEHERAPLLATAARILYLEASLECADALELVGLAQPLDGSCGCG
jgi:hypothetical protein